MPVLAANTPRRYVNRVSRLGAAALLDLGAGARRFLPPLPCAKASPEYEEKFKQVMEESRREEEKRIKETGKTASPALTMDLAKGLEAQNLWDAGMAYSIANFLTRNPDMRVLHCTGSFHIAEKLGAVEHLARYRPGVSMLVVTMMSDKSFPEFDIDKMKDQGDFVIVTDPDIPRSYSIEPSPKPTHSTKK